jgi:hypothetical protein
MKLKTKLILGAVALVLLVGGGRMAYVATTTSIVTDTFVRDSERVCSQSDAQKCKYIAFGQNETYENTDTWAFLKFNSSDVNKSLVRGATCTLKVYGFRVPFMSWYRNIITAECTTRAETFNKIGKTVEDISKL